MITTKDYIIIGDLTINLKKEGKEKIEQNKNIFKNVKEKIKTKIELLKKEQFGCESVALASNTKADDRTYYYGIATKIYDNIQKEKEKIEILDFFIDYLYLTNSQSIHENIIYKLLKDNSHKNYFYALFYAFNIYTKDMK